MASKSFLLAPRKEYCLATTCMGGIFFLFVSLPNRHVSGHNTMKSSVIENKKIWEKIEKLSFEKIMKIFVQ